MFLTNSDSLVKQIIKINNIILLFNCYNKKCFAAALHRDSIYNEIIVLTYFCLVTI